MDLDTERVFKIIDQILGPLGCPWAKKQSARALCQYVEESYEVIDAIELKDPEKIQEEIGDVLFTLLITIAVACKEFDISPIGIVETISKKIIRRHPHVFENPRPISFDLMSKYTKKHIIKKPLNRSYLEVPSNSFYEQIEAYRPLLQQLLLQLFLPRLPHLQQHLPHFLLQQPEVPQD